MRSLFVHRGKPAPRSGSQLGKPVSRAEAGSGPLEGTLVVRVQALRHKRVERRAWGMGHGAGSEGLAIESLKLGAGEAESVVSATRRNRPASDRCYRVAIVAYGQSRPSLLR